MQTQIIVRNKRLSSAMSLNLFYFISIEVLFGIVMYVLDAETVENQVLYAGKKACE